MIHDDWKQRMRDLAEAIAPELGHRVYVLDASELGDYPTPDDCYAWTRPNRHSVDGNLRRLLIQRGEWWGVGPIIVLHSDLIEADRSMPIGGHISQLFCHELAHCLPVADYPADVEPPEAFLPLQLQLARAIARQPEVRRDQLPWLDDSTHGWRFIRRCCHLVWRANALRFIVPVDSFAGPQYGLSHARAYYHAIHDEPIRMANATFEEIESTEPPAEFTDLWATDVERWHAFSRKATA